jgi:pimeloyl-ACP methyl ester carboxylesterase
MVARILAESARENPAGRARVRRDYVRGQPAMSRPHARPLRLSIAALVLGAGLLPAPRLVAAGEAAVDGPPAAVFQYGSLRFEPCTLAQPGLAATAAARCAKLAVPEDRARPDGRRIEVAVAWVPARTREAAADPVVLLAGGPGQSALEAYPAVQGAFRDVLRKRHVLLVDQRGTGRSHPMNCPLAIERHGTAANDDLAPAWARALAGDCLAEVVDDADPRHYTTSDYIADLESVREALGIRQFNLVGVSYGSRVGFEYLRRHPQRIRTLTADSVVPPTLALGSEHARNLEQALDLQFARCSADSHCASQFGSPRANLGVVLARLREQPASVSYRDPLTHEPRVGDLTATDVAGVVRLHMYSPELAAMLPMLLAEAAGGRHDTLMAQARMVEQLVGEQIALPLQLSVSCAEDAPRLTADPRDRDTLLGTAFVEALRAQCEVWPRGRAPAGFDAPLASDRPVLLLSGEFDPVTPPRYAESMRGGLSNSRHLSVRGQGHGALQAGCVPRLFAEFVAGADARALDARCIERQPRTPLFEGPQGWGP